MNPLTAILAKKKIILSPEIKIEAEEKKSVPVAPPACHVCGSLVFWHSVYNRDPHCLTCEPNPPKGLYGGLIDHTPGGYSLAPQPRELARVHSSEYIAQHWSPWPNDWSRIIRNRKHASLADPLTLAECTRCSSRDFRDVEIHSGRSTRRECSRCGLTQGFPRWTGSDRTALAGNQIAAIASSLEDLF